MQIYGSLLDSLVGVTWPARRATAAGLPGSHPSRIRGTTSEFNEYRAYRQGDDPRRLDWKLLARTDRPYLRITDDHSIRTTLIVLDASASLAFPEDSLAKWEQACRIAVGLAAVARAGGDPVGLVAATRNGPVRLAPRSRQGVIGEIVNGLDAIAPGGSPSLADALEGIRPGWRVVIISDFLGDEPAVRARAGTFVVEGVEVYAVHIVAMDELNPGDNVRLAVDPEQPGIQRVLHPDVVSQYTARFQQWRSETAALWRLSGAEYVEVGTDEDAARAVRRIARGV